MLCSLSSLKEIFTSKNALCCYDQGVEIPSLDFCLRRSNTLQRDGSRGVVNFNKNWNFTRVRRIQYWWLLYCLAWDISFVWCWSIIISTSFWKWRLICIFACRFQPNLSVQTHWTCSTYDALLLRSIKVIPWYCIAHPYCARFSRH